jgi:hypothetical protein
MNKEADVLAVRGAASHCVPLALRAQLRRQSQVTVQWQRTLIAIHADRAAYWQAQQAQAVVAEVEAGSAWDDEAERDPFAEQERRDDLKTLLQAPARALPRYCWVMPESGSSFKLKPLPARIGAAKKAEHRVKGHPDHNPWQYGTSLLEPLFWFWNSLHWAESARAGTDEITSVTLFELAVIFQLLTGVIPTKEAIGNETMQARVHWFQCASRRLASMCGCSFCPGKEICANDSDVSRRLRFQHGPAVGGRPIIPDVYWKHFVAVILRAHLSVPIPDGCRHRKLDWIPDFDRPPPPLWRPGAPAGFGEAARWLRERNLDAQLAGENSAGSQDASSSGQSPGGFAAPSVTHVRRRLSGKQSVPVVAMPVCQAMRPRAKVQPEKLSVEALSAQEKAVISGLAGVMLNQALKRLQHNRSAVECGKHYIVDDGQGQIKCRDCPMHGRWQEWKFFSKVAKCKRLVPSAGD